MREMIWAIVLVSAAVLSSHPELAVNPIGVGGAAVIGAVVAFDRLLDRPPLRLTAIRPAGPEVPKTLRPRSCRAVSCGRTPCHLDHGIVCRPRRRAAGPVTPARDRSVVRIPAAICHRRRTWSAGFRRNYPARPGWSQSDAQIISRIQILGQSPDHRLGHQVNGARGDVNLGECAATVWKVDSGLPNCFRFAT